MSILIVDDDPAIRTMLVDLLEDEGHVVSSAANGQEALTYLQRAANRPQLILLDLMMPLMDGWQFRTLQRQDPELAPIPVIVLSAGENLKRAAATLAADAYFAKPVDFDALLRTVALFCP